MFTALDTNIISALWSAEPTKEAIENALFAASKEGGLVVSAPVYAELLAYPKATQAFVDSFFATLNISVDFEFSRDIWLESGKAYANYAKRRRKVGSGQPKRVLPDFIIGAHALLKTDRLLTLDVGRYKTSFPKLELLTF